MLRMSLVALVLFAAAALPVAAQIADETTGAEESKQTGSVDNANHLYGWTDSKGVVHITDSMGNVPKQYRSSAHHLEYAPGQTAPGPEPAQDNAVQSGAARNRNEAQQKVQWQRRMQAARQRLADAESRYRALEQKRNELLGSWGGIASGHYEGRVEAERVERDMKQVQQEIDSARSDLETVIPDEARKAAIPPGWMRE